MLHREHAATDSDSLIIHFVVLLPQDASGERKRTLCKGEGTYNLPKAGATNGESCRSNLLQALLKVSLRPHFTSFMQVSTAVSNPTCCGELVFSRMAFLQLQPNAGPLLPPQSHWPDIADSSSTEQYNFLYIGKKTATYLIDQDPVR